MSDNTLTGDDLENLLLSWKKKYGNEHLNKVGNPYLKIEKGDMRTAMNALVNTFILRGYDHEDLKSNLLSQQIQIALTPHKYDGKLKEWRLMIAQQWKNALNEYFPAPIEEAVIHDPLDKPVVVIPGESSSVFVSRPKIDKSQLKGLVIPEYTIIENDPLAFLKKGENE
jgi:hypothetical protein